MATYGGPAQEILVASTDRPSFARVIYNPAEVFDQALRPDSLEAPIGAEDYGYRLTLTARTYARDAFCMVDKVDPAASIDGGMATLLPGESVVWHIASAPVDVPETFLPPGSCGQPTIYSVRRCEHPFEGKAKGHPFRFLLGPERSVSV